MINLYLIDYDNEQKNNGLNTYVNQLVNGIVSNPIIKLHYVWVNSLKYKEFTKELAENIFHLHMPNITNSQAEPNAFDIKVAAILAEDMQGKENIVVHFNWINHCSLAWYIKQKVNCNTILTKHCIPWRDLVIDNYKEFYELNKAFIKKERLHISNPRLKKEQFSYENLDHIITNTICAKTSLNVLFNVPSSKITVINNGIDAKDFKNHRQSQKDKLRQKYGFSPNEKLIIFAGNVNARKGIIELVQTFEKIASIKDYQNTRLVIVGPGDYALVLKTAKKHWSKITLTGSLDKNTLYDFYAIADMGIVPSYVEQFSYTAMEMMLSELPIIVTDVDGLKEMIQDDCGFKIKIDYQRDGLSFDVLDLMDKICHILNNEKEAMIMAKKAKIHAGNHFSAIEMVQKTLAVYVELVKIKPFVSDYSSEVHENTYVLSPNPKVSIILPCYNAGRYLQECLESVFAQTFTDFELILIDDGSDDDIETIIKSNNDPRLIYIRSSVNRGIVPSLNKGLKLAKGKYIARMDSDDIMAKMRLQIQVDFLEKNLDYGMVGCWHNVINPDGMLINRMQYPIDNEELRLLLLFRNQFSHPSVLLRASVVRGILYDGDFKYCEDYELWTRIAEITKVANIPEYLLSYRVHDKSSSILNHKIVQQNVIALLSRELDKVGIVHSVEELMLHAAVCFGAAPMLLKSKEKQKVLRKWLNKVFASSILNQRYDKLRLDNLKKFISQGYCGMD